MYCPRLCFIASLVLAVVLLLPGNAAIAQSCHSFDQLIVDWSRQPDAVPTTKRAMAVELMTWQGKRFLFLNNGDGLRLYNANSSLNPVFLEDREYVCSYCPAHEPGDYDWVQFNFSVCNDCRYGVSHFWKAGLALLDLGTGAVPSLRTGARYYEAPVDTLGAFVFKHNGQQYLIINNLQEANPDDFPVSSLNCDAQGNPTLFRMDGIQPSDLTELQCLEQGISVMNGLYLSSGGSSYVYLIDRATFAVSLYRITGTGNNLELIYEGSPFASNSKFGKGLRADLAHDLLVTAVNGTPSARLWDISDLGQPVELATFDSMLGVDRNGQPVKVARAAIRYPLVWLGKYSGLETYTFNIFDPTNPQPVDTDFWDPSQTWNSNTLYPFLANTDGEISQDGTALYVSRYSVAQLFDVSACGPDLPPTADLQISPSPAFPGDQITLTNTTVGVVEASALWITDVAGTIVAGSPALAATTPDSLDFDLMRNLPGAQSYTAHVAVENSQNPFNPAAPGDQLSETGVLIDRAPQAVISITPDTAITGDTITLSGTDSEGYPAVVGGGTPYQWTITPPTATSWSGQGAQLVVQLTESGEWRFDLTAQYEHYTQQGFLYSATTSKTKSFTSVAADFTAIGSPNPARLCMEEPIILDASPSQAMAGAELQYTWKAGGSNLPCSASEEQCTLAADSLNAGLYDFTLTLRNTINNDVSIKTKRLEVAKCSFTPVINVNNDTPNIGELVIFLITGVPGEIEEAQWNMGGPGCETGQTITCTPSALGCRSQTFKYSTAGSKAVTLSVETGGITVAADPISLQVQNAGGCGTTETCSYSIAPTSRSFPSTGGSGSFQVSASESDCSWSASTSTGWISITSGTGGMGSGSVSYSVGATSGSARNGSIKVSTEEQPLSHQVSQAGVSVPDVDFSISNTTPEIGETITFQASDCTPIRWQLGGVSCDDEGPAVDCSGCLVQQWAYRDAGAKTVTLVCSEGSKSRSITVQGSGSCGDDCQRDGPPNASFSMTPNPIETGQQVSFQTQAKSGGGKRSRPPLLVASSLSAGLSWYPQSPKIGQLVSLTLTNAGTVTESTWDFGEPGCSGYEQVNTCVENGGVGVATCDKRLHRFASAGEKSVTVSFKSGGSPITIGPQTIVVDSAGSCPGSTCAYSIDPSSRSFGAAGGSGTVSVSSDAGCAWSAVPSSGWITVTAGSAGSGDGTVSYQVQANSGQARSAELRIADKALSISQEAGGGGGGGTDADWWQWQVRKDGQLVFSRSTASFTKSFSEAGTYTVQLTVGNCRGSTSSQQTLVVNEPPIEPPVTTLIDSYVVPAVAHIPGAYNTLWVSDLKMFNPDADPIKLDLQFLPQIGSGQVVPGIKVTLDAFETVVYPDLLTRLFGQGNEGIKGGLLVTLDEGDHAPSIMSRTFNDTPTGTYGQFVPAVPMLPRKGNVVYLTGLKHNADFRSNLGIANGSGTFASATATVLDPWGQQLGQPFTISIKKYSTQQVASISEKCGISRNLDLFTVRLQTSGLDVVAYASVVDNISGDSIVQLATETEATEVIIPGVAHNPGLHGSSWRSDVTLFNPSSSPLPFLLFYIPEEDIGYDPYYQITLPPGGAWGDTDLLANLLVLGVPDGGTKGYLRITGIDGGLAPQVVARTYNQTESNGTYGQAIPGFTEEIFVHEGERGFFPGLSNASYGGDRFRSNVGFVNLDPDNQAVIDLILFNKYGTTVGIKTIQLEPSQYRQFNLFTELGLGEQPIEGSATLELQSGGPIIAYTSVVTDRTGDPFFMPLQIDTVEQ